MKVKQIKNKGVLLVLWIIAMIFLNSVIGLYTTKKSQVETTSEYYQEINEQPLSSWYNTPYDPENAETPDLPEFYNFMDGPIPRYGIFLESHYGTHDWIADAALRLLINENEQGPLDWNWLLNDGVINNLLWQDDYADLNNKHYAVRSYILFLFATQMPDMDPDDANVPRPNRDPQYIDLWENEGEIIGNNKPPSQPLGTWVGKTEYMTFHWNIIDSNGDFYSVGTPLSPKPVTSSSPQKAPWYADKMGKIAIEYLTNNDKDPQDNQVKRYSKVESAASWLGCMSHYITDLASPPHLIQEGDGYYPKSPKYHRWIEYQTTLQTVWDIDNRGPFGYFDPPFEFFDINPVIINKDPHNIKSLEPGLAAQEMAVKGITASYGGVNEDGLYLRKGYPNQEDLVDSWQWTDSNR